MDLYEAIEIICKDYCKYPDIESGNKLADICDKCPMNKCEVLRWAEQTKPTTQTKTQNSNLTFKTLEYCDICDHKGCEECIANALDEHCVPSQFKKQIKDECAKEYEELGLKELKELINADRKTEPQLTPNYCGTCKYREVPCGDLPCDVCHGYSNYEPKTENSSEKPNNCEHITEDGVTCAKYPACDDCPDNPLNKVKGSERLVKGSEKPNKSEIPTCSTISKMEQVETMSCQECKHWDVYKGCRERVCKYEPKDEPTGYNLSPVEPQTERSE